MNTDFRVTIGFFKHPKTRRLKRRHGDTAVVCLLRLWEFAAQFRTKGVLYDMEKDDIIDISEWPGDGEFVDSLLEFELLQKNGNWYEIHDWRNHNGWAYHAEERTESARKAAEAKWKMHRKDGGKTNA